MLNEKQKRWWKNFQKFNVGVLLLQIILRLTQFIMLNNQIEILKEQLGIL
ncbi:MAG: hypothetical protein PVF83_11430 [Anaerolineales bacterium]|jgi:hypothetical protein